MRKSYKKRPVLRDVSFKLKKGEAIALLGPNGTGKTTCFYSVVGLTSIESGKIIIDEIDATNLPMYKRAHWPLVSRVKYFMVCLLKKYRGSPRK